jgi:hypothetical protein
VGSLAPAFGRSSFVLDVFPLCPSGHRAAAAFGCRTGEDLRLKLFRSQMLLVFEVGSEWPIPRHRSIYRCLPFN